MILFGARVKTGARIASCALFPILYLMGRGRVAYVDSPCKTHTTLLGFVDATT